MWDDEYSWIDGDDFDEEGNDEEAARLNREEEMDAWLEEDFGVPLDGPIDGYEAGDEGVDEFDFDDEDGDEDDDEWLE